MAALLVSYTIYTDTTYAISSVTSQLFVLEVMPGTLEISLYALASTISGVICTVGFMAIRPYVPIRLETWLLIGYGIMILIPVWGSIGLSASVVNFGFKVSFDTKHKLPIRSKLQATSRRYSFAVVSLLTGAYF